MQMTTTPRNKLHLRSTADLRDLQSELAERQIDERDRGDHAEARRFGILIDAVHAELKRRGEPILWAVV